MATRFSPRIDSMEESDVRTQLSEIDQFKSNQQMRHLCLLASRIPDIAYTQLYGSESVYDVLNELKEKYHHKEALKLLLKMMEFAGFSMKRLARLSSLLNDDQHQHDHEDISAIDFSYQRLLVFIANNLGDGELLKKVVNALTDKERGIAADQVTTAHALLYHMTNAGTLVDGNYESLKILMEKFKAVGLKALADNVHERIQAVTSGEIFDSDDMLSAHMEAVDEMSSWGTCSSSEVESKSEPLLTPLHHRSYSTKSDMQSHAYGIAPVNPVDREQAVEVATQEEATSESVIHVGFAKGVFKSVSRYLQARFGSDDATYQTRPPTESEMEGSDDSSDIHSNIDKITPTLDVANVQGSSSEERKPLLTSQHRSYSTESGRHVHVTGAPNSGRITLHCKIKICGLLIAIVMTFSIIIAIVTTIGGYELPHPSEPQTFELMIGDVVDCTRHMPNYLSAKDIAISLNTTAPDIGNPEILLKSVSEKDFEALKENRSDVYAHDSYQVPASSSRFAIPTPSWDKLGYTMSGSSISVSVCLQSNLSSPNDAHLFVFDTKTTTDNFLDNKTNSTHDAVFPPHTLKVGVMNKTCTDVDLPVNHSAYYHLALEVPSDGRITVSYTITVDQVYINGSNLSHFKPCVVDNTTSCPVNLSPSHKLLCYFPESTGPDNASLSMSQPQCGGSTDDCTVYLSVELIPRFVVSAMRITGIVLLSVFGVLFVVLVIGFVRHKCSNM